MYFFSLKYHQIRQNQRHYGKFVFCCCAFAGGKEQTVPTWPGTVSPIEHCVCTVRVSNEWVILLTCASGNNMYCIWDTSCLEVWHWKPLALQTFPQCSQLPSARTHTHAHAHAHTIVQDALHTKQYVCVGMHSLWSFYSGLDQLLPYLLCWCSFCSLGYF